MNITHTVHEEVKGDKLFAIFDRQKELMGKYHEIEKRSGLLQTEDCPVNLDDKRGQARIKDYAWRVMEELGEAFDAYYKLDSEHVNEEMVDGLHFLTELTILAGYGPEDIVDFKPEDTDQDFLDYMVFQSRKKLPLCYKCMPIIRDMGMMCNCLKNKPWKQTNMITDKNEFLKMLKKVWGDYVDILSTFMKSDDIADIYFRKSQVNKFRQRSGY